MPRTRQSSQRDNIHPDERRHSDYSQFHQMIVLPTLAPTTSLNALANRPYNPPAETPENIAEASKENAAIRAAAQRPTGQPVVQSPARRALGPTQAVERDPTPPTDIDADEAHEDGNDSDDEHPLSVTMYYRDATIQDGKARSRDKNVTKNGTVALQDITRVKFARRMLELHQLQDTYAPRADSGFSFKLWAPRMDGGKSYAPTIETDVEFNRQVASMLKKVNRVAVHASFDTEEMAAFAAVKRKGLPEGFETQPIGTRVPRLGQFSREDQLQGELYQRIQAQHICQEHRGEHGEPGSCYIGSVGQHLRLTNPMLSDWARAIMTGSPGTTIREPPSIPAFDGARDGRDVGPRPRGRTGPGPAPQNCDQQGQFMPLLTSATAALSATANALAAIVPKLSDTPMPTASAPVPPPTVQRARSLSSIPEPEDELSAFLTDFKYKYHLQIDMEALGDRLDALSLTPDIINDVPNERLESALKLSLGHVVKLKAYAREWSAHLLEKRRAPSVEL